MARNIEIKTVLRDRAAVVRALGELSARDRGEETQHDVFWRTPTGRLKLRVSSRDGAHLIAYAREDRAALRVSSYERVPVADADALRRALDAVLPPGGEVRKRRRLYWLDGVRVHLDEVEGLGEFLELEAVVTSARSESACAEAASRLLERFRIGRDEHVAVAYVDLREPRDARDRIDASATPPYHPAP